VKARGGDAAERLRARARAGEAAERFRARLSAGHGERITRGLGAPALFAIALSGVGASLYFALGVVAGKALGLTPVAFLLAALFFVLAMMSYVEGGSLHPERGGASTLARYAFNELWSFVAGWAILLDYLIVMALGSFTIAHYLSAFWGRAGDSGVEQAIAAAALGYVVWTNIRGISARRLQVVLRIGIVNFLVMTAVVVAGAALVLDWGAITDSVDLGSQPTWQDLVVAAVIATISLTGIEAASGLAGEIRAGRSELRRVVLVGTATVLFLLVGVSLIALMAVPATNGSTDLGGRFIEAPVLGIVSAYHPAWFVEALRYAVGASAAFVLLQAVNGNMLGLSRLAYSLATNRQIPSAVGRLHHQRTTPYVAITTAALLAFCLVLTSDVEFMAGIFAFGAMLAFAIAHASVIALRFREPEAARAFRVPLSVAVGRGSIPLPAALGLVTAIGAWVSVLAYHEGARIVGLSWMAGGLLLYVVYRKGQGKPLAQRFTIPPEALKEAPEVEYGSLLVPVFGAPIDDDIMGTAGRLAAEEGEEGEGGAVIEAIYVLEIPMSLPIDARVPPEKVADARRALARAKEVGEEYAGVEVAGATARARSLGAGIVDEARRRGVEAIVLAAEEPTRMRGGALLGGLGGPRDRIVGEMTKYVLEKAPCRVILTAAPASGDGRPEPDDGDRDARRAGDGRPDDGEPPQPDVALE
jgi:basic amino acid/polyamine antiporter, APA family